MIPKSCARTAAPGMVLVLLSNENPDNMEVTQGGLWRLEKKTGSQGLPGHPACSDPWWTVQEPVVTSQEMTVIICL